MAAQAKPGVAKPATAATGGRLVCLTDGREYTIGNVPLVFGREAGCDIVVPNKDVSRRHAEVMATPQGYVLVDSSTNGTFVNGEAIEAQRLLARADVIRVGDHEFRFYADRAAETPPNAGASPPLAPAPAEAVVPVSPAPPAPPPIVPVPPPIIVPAGAENRLSHTMHGMPVTPPPAPAIGRAARDPVPPPPPAPPAPAVPITGKGQAAPSAPPPPRASMAVPPLASLLVRSGQLKGTRLPIRVPVVNIGRAEYNDLVIPDESVSTMHAKLQRREEIWVLTDNASTNGTFVDGDRVPGEAILSPGAMLRLGEVQLMFEPADEGGVKKGSGTKVMAAMPMPSPAPFSPPSVTPPVAPVPLPPVAPMAPMAPPRATPPELAQPVPPRPSTGEPILPAPRTAPRRPAVISSPQSQGMPGWLIPVIVVVALAVVAAVLLLR
jgi:pSer/pThr/pTyr-binding forkhead associated (FHA) protein